MLKQNVKQNLTPVILVLTVIFIAFSTHAFALNAPPQSGEMPPGSEDVPITVILQRASGYCEKLKSAAFYYFCVEDITEIYNHYPTYRDFRQKRNRDKSDQEINHYIYDYQILKKDKLVNEKRVLTEKNGKKMSVGNAPLLTRYSYSYRSFYGPITLLSKDRQPHFDYKILERDDNEKGRIAVIEARPNKNAPNDHHYGKVWISIDTGEVFRIEVDARSISGTDGMKQIAKKYGATPHLRITHEYDVQHQGLRYPGKTQFVESYSGGVNLRRKFKDGCYVRSDTTYLYKDYIFYNVDVRMKIDQ